MGSPKLKPSAIAVVKGRAPAQVIQILHDQDVRHVVQEDGWDFAGELKAAQTMENQPELFFKDPLAVILARSAADLPQKISLKTRLGDKKTNTLSAFEAFVASLTGVKTITEQAKMIADEIFTNAHKSAPKNSNGEIEFFSAASHGRLVIGCRDSFGKLNPQTIVDRLKLCYQQGVAQSIRQDTPGAGIGSFMIFDASVSYFAAAKKNHTTIVCAVLPLGITRRQAEVLSKNIHLLEID